MDRPAWNNLAIGPQDYYYYYIRPGDTLQLDIENFGKWNEKVSYANKQGRPCYETLVTKGEVIYGEGEFLLGVCSNSNSPEGLWRGYSKQDDP